MSPILCLFYNGVGVQLECVDKPALSGWAGSPYRILPEPDGCSLALTGIHNDHYRTYWRVTSPPTHSPAGRGVFGTFGLRRASMTMFAWRRASWPSATSECSSITKNKFIRSQPMRHPSVKRSVSSVGYTKASHTLIEKGKRKRSEKVCVRDQLPDSLVARPMTD